MDNVTGNVGLQGAVFQQVLFVVWLEKPEKVENSSDFAYISLTCSANNVYGCQDVYTYASIAYNGEA